MGGALLPWYGPWHKAGLEHGQDRALRSVARS
jgi:hypothetical protein